MAYIYNLTDTWNAGGTVFSSIKMVVTNTASAAGSALLDLSVSGATSGTFVVDKSANLTLSGKINNYTFTSPATGATIALADGSSLTTIGGYALTLTTTGVTSLTLPTSGTVATTSNNLGAFASTTSSQLAGVISDETGSGSLVFATSPTLVTPSLGTPTALTLTNATGLPVGGISATGTPSGSTYLRGDGTWATVSSGSGDVVGPASATDNAVARFDGTTGKLIQNSAVTIADSSGDITGGKYNKVTITAPATGSTLTIADGKTLTASNTLTFTGTDSSSVAFGAGGTVAYTGGTLAQFASTTSSQLAGVISDETGTGSLVFSTAPTFGTNITVGTASSSTGIVNLKGTTSGTVALSVADAAGTWTMKLPTSAGTNGYYLQTDGAGNTSWAAGGGGGSGSPGGSNTQVQFNDSGAFGGDADFTWNKTTNALTVGTASSTQGSVVLANTSANSVTLQASNSTSAAWTLTLPTTAGTNGYALTTNGSGVTSWSAVATGDVVGPASATDNAVVRFDGTTGKLVQNSAVTIADTSGDITGGKYNKVTITAPATAATLTIADGKTLTASNTLTFTGTDSSSVAFGTGGTVAYTGGTLAQFASTTSSQLAGVISDETGSGSLVFATSPTLVTPNIGAATATSVNGLTVTSSTGTLTITNGKTLSASNTLTLAGTDSTTMTFPATSSTVLTTGNTATIAKGFTVTKATLTANTSFTVDPTLANYQYLSNNASITITAYTAADHAVDIYIANASGGTLGYAFSGFTVVTANTATPPLTTTGKWILSIRCINGVATYSVYVIAA